MNYYRTDQQIKQFPQTISAIQKYNENRRLSPPVEYQRQQMAVILFHFQDAADVIPILDDDFKKQ